MGNLTHSVCQIPTYPPPIPVQGGVGRNIDRCIIVPSHNIIIISIILFDDYNFIGLMFMKWKKAKNEGGKK